MFCPKCKSEYNPGYTVCNDCRIELVAELPVVDEEAVEYLEYEEILTTNSPGDLSLLKSLLDAEGITYIFQGEHVAPFILYAIPLRLLVRKDQVERTLEILQDIKLSSTFGGQHKIEEENEETSATAPAGARENILLSEGASLMESLIFKYIDFRYCYYCLFATIGSIIIGFILWPLKIIPQSTLHIPQQIVAFFLSLYVYLGYVKYSYIEAEAKVRTIILLVIALSIIGSIFSLLTPSLNLEKTRSTLYTAIPVLISTPLLFYGFRLIQTAEITYFRKLSKLNLYFLIIGALFSLLFISRLSNYLSILMLVLAAIVTFVSMWYWEIKLFKHLSKKYNEIKS